MALQGTPYHPLQQHVDDQVDGFDTKDNLEPPQSASTPKKTYFGIITMIILVISLAGSNGVLLWHEAHKGCYPPDHQPYCLFLPSRIEECLLIGDRGPWENNPKTISLDYRIL